MLSLCCPTRVLPRSISPFPAVAATSGCAGPSDIIPSSNKISPEFFLNLFSSKF